MRYEIILAPAAATAFTKLPARHRAMVRDALERHLRHEPAKTSKSRIKRLRGLRQPQYRLRIDDLRVFYDIQESEVQVLAIVPKSQAEAWLKQEGKSREEGGAGEGEG